VAQLLKKTKNMPVENVIFFSPSSSSFVYISRSN